MAAGPSLDRLAGADIDVLRLAMAESDRADRRCDLLALAQQRRERAPGIATVLALPDAALRRPGVEDARGLRVLHHGADAPAYVARPDRGPDQDVALDVAPRQVRGVIDRLVADQGERGFGDRLQPVAFFRIVLDERLRGVVRHRQRSGDDKEPGFVDAAGAFQG